MLKWVLVVFSSLFLLALVGCGNGLTTDFSKSGRYAFTLVKSAESGERVSELTVTEAFSKAESDAKSSSDKATLKLLQDYLQAFRLNDETPEANAVVKACHESLRQVFDDNADAEQASAGCKKAQADEAEAIIRKTTEEDQKSAAKGKK